LLNHSWLSCFCFVLLLLLFLCTNSLVVTLGYDNILNLGT
jgi:hypothetical protein